MLIDTSYIYGRTATTDIWLDQVQEIYPCGRAKKVSVRRVSTYGAVRKLRAMQGQSLISWAKDQYLNVMDMLRLQERKLASC